MYLSIDRIDQDVEPASDNMGRESEYSPPNFKQTGAGKHILHELIL